MFAFLNFSASEAAGIHFGRAAGAPRLQKAGLEAPEAPQDSAKRPKGRPLGDKRAPKETPGQPKGRQRDAKRAQTEKWCQTKRRKLTWTC